MGFQSKKTPIHVQQTISIWSVAQVRAGELTLSLTTGDIRLIALLLGRLRLPVSEAKDIFTKLLEELFSEQKYKFQEELFKATILKKAI